MGQSPTMPRLVDKIRRLNPPQRARTRFTVYLAGVARIQSAMRLTTAAAQYDFTVGHCALGPTMVQVFDADRAVALQDDAMGGRMHMYRQVRPVPRRMQEGARRAAPTGIPHGRLTWPDTALAHAVVVGIVGQANLLKRPDARQIERVDVMRLRHLQPAVGAVVGVVEDVVRFHRAEVRQDILVRPMSGVAHRFLPARVVAGLSMDVHHCVD